MLVLSYLKVESFRLLSFAIKLSKRVTSSGYQALLESGLKLKGRFNIVILNDFLFHNPLFIKLLL